MEAEGTGLEVPPNSAGNPVNDSPFGTTATRAYRLPNSEAAIDLRFSELRDLWALADDEARDAILQAVRERILTSKGVQS